MSGGGMQAQQGVGTAASGGKGGQMGGPNMSGMSQVGNFDIRPAVMPEASAGGKGGEKPFVPDESGGRLRSASRQPRTPLLSPTPLRPA